MITTGDAHGEMLLVMIPALSNVVISFCTQSYCLSDRVYGFEAIGGESPVSMSISTSSDFPMSSLTLEIMSSNRSHSLINSCLVSSLIFLSSRSTFRCASASAGDLMKLLADVRMLCRSVSVCILAILMIGHCDRAGIQFLGVMCTCSILKISPSVSSFSVNATTWFSRNSKYWSLLRFTIMTGVTESWVFSDRSA